MWLVCQKFQFRSYLPQNHYSRPKKVAYIHGFLQHPQQLKRTNRQNPPGCQNSVPFLNKIKAHRRIQKIHEKSMSDLVWHAQSAAWAWAGVLAIPTPFVPQNVPHTGKSLFPSYRSRNFADGQQYPSDQSSLVARVILRGAAFILIIHFSSMG
jgi:hypothetical protein